MPKITALPAMTVIAADDLLPIVDTSAGATKKVSNSLLTGYPDLGWTAAAETWAYSSWNATTRIGVFTVPTDATLKYTPGNRIRITQSTGGTKYGLLMGVTATQFHVLFQVGVTFNNEAISSPMFSVVDTPFGFSKKESLWALEASSTTTWNQATPTIGTWYNTTGGSLLVGYGAYQIYYEVCAASQGNGAASSPYTTLSTANNTESDIRMSTRSYDGVSGTLVLHTIHREKEIDITSNTTYYLNMKTDATSSYLNNFASQSTQVIRAIPTGL